MHPSKQHSWCPCGTNRRLERIHFSPSLGIYFAPHQYAINNRGHRKALCVCRCCVIEHKIFSHENLRPLICLFFIFSFRLFFESKARRLSGVQTMMNGNSLIIFTKICFTLLNKSLITLVKQMDILSLAVNSIKVAGLLSVCLLAYWTNYAKFTH